MVQLFKLFSILVYKQEERYLDIKSILFQFLNSIDQDFNKAFKESKCTEVTSKQFVESVERGFAEFELMIVLLTYLFKKNIRFYYLAGQQLSLQLQGESSPSHRFGEFNLVYDMSPEQAFLKLFIRASKPQYSSSNEINLMSS